MNTNYLIIAGTFKSGTSALFLYLSRLSGVNASSKKETGFFVPARYNEPLPDINLYLSYFNALNKGVKLEASPGYLYGKELVAQSIKSNLGDNVKIIFLLREPTDRFISFYKMLSSGFINDLNIKAQLNDFSLKTYFEKCKLHTSEDNYENEKLDYVFNGLFDGCYLNYLKSWYDIFGEENIRISFFDELAENPQDLCEGVMNWAGLDDENIADIDYKIVNQFRAHKYQLVRKIARKINTQLEYTLRKSPKLKSVLVNLYNKINVDERKQEDLDEQIVNQIKEYYRPFNDELREFLLEKKVKNIPDWLFCYE